MQTRSLRRWVLPVAVAVWACSAQAVAGSNKAANAEFVRQVTVASTRVAQVEQALLDAESRVVQLEEVVRERGQQEAQRLDNLDQVVAEINRLRGSIEELQFAVDDIKLIQEQTLEVNEVRILHSELRLAQIEAFLNIEPPPVPVLNPTDSPTEPADPGEGAVAVGAVADPAEEPAAEEPPPEDAAGVLRLGVSHMEAGRHGVARALLNKGVKDYPGEPELAEIRYRIAETWMNEEKYPKAIRAFEQVITHHRADGWAAWSMLRQGECFEALGEPGDAEIFYSEVVRAYPKSDASKEAKQRLGG